MRIILSFLFLFPCISAMAASDGLDTLRYRGNTIVVNTDNLKEIYRQNGESIDGINVNWLYKGDITSRDRQLYPKGTVVFASIVYFPSTIAKMLKECISQEGIHDVKIYIRGDGYISIKYMIEQYHYRREMYDNGIIEVGYKEATDDNVTFLDNLIESIIIIGKQ